MKYFLIDPANFDEQTLPTVEKAFALWKSVYTEELESRGMKLHEEDFWNARLLAVIEDNGEIIGTHIYNVFDIRTSTPTSHRYFADIPVSRVEEFRQQGVRTLMSMEYLMVNPKFRGKHSTVRWGEVVIGLGFKVMLHSPWDSIVGIARADKGVNDMGRKMGCRETDFLVKNQTPCRVMFMTREELKPHQDTATQAIIDKLWMDKINHSPWFQSPVLQVSRNKKAA